MGSARARNPEWAVDLGSWVGVKKEHAESKDPSYQDRFHEQSSLPVMGSRTRAEKAAATASAVGWPLDSPHGRAVGKQGAGLETCFGAHPHTCTPKEGLDTMYI